MKRCRTIVVAGHQYRWRRYHRHTFTPAKQCHEIVVVYDPRAKRAPVRFTFTEQPDWCVGYPLAGVLLFGMGDAGLVFNLNRPAVIAALIEVAFAEGWQPLHQPKPFELVNRFDVLIDQCQAVGGYG